MKLFVEDPFLLGVKMDLYGAIVFIHSDCQQGSLTLMVHQVGQMAPGRKGKGTRKEAKAPPKDKGEASRADGPQKEAQNSGDSKDLLKACRDAQNWNPQQDLKEKAEKLSKAFPANAMRLHAQARSLLVCKAPNSSPPPPLEDLFNLWKIQLV